MDDQKIIEGQTIDLRTARVQPTGVTLLREVNLVENAFPSALCQIGPNTYVGFGNGVIKKVQLSNGSLSNFAICRKPITGMAAYKGKIFCLESDTASISIISMSGKINQQLPIKPTGDGSDIVIVGEKIVVSNKAKQVLQVYSTGGGAVREIKCLQWTQHSRVSMVAYNNSSVIVCDTVSQRILRVNVDTGHVLWNRTNITSPSGTSICGGRVIVTNGPTEPQAWILGPDTG